MLVRSLSALVLVVSASFAGGVQAAASNQSQITGGCNAARDCAAVFPDGDAGARRLCRSANAAVAWRKSEATYLVQCIDTSTAEENVNYLVRQPNTRATMLDYGRYVDKSVLLANPAGPTVPPLPARALCSPADPEKVQASDFVLLNRRPAPGTNGYCYDVTYVHADGADWSIKTNSGDVQPGDAAYYGPAVSAPARADLRRMLRNLRRLAQ